MKIILAAALTVCCLAGPPAHAVKDVPPSFSLPSLESGGMIDLDDYLGKKYVVLNFWARWCYACRDEIPQLEALMKQPGAETAVFLGVNVGDRGDKAGKFAEKYHYPYRTVLDGDKSVTNAYGVMGLPFTVIIAPDGRIIYRGFRPPESFDFTK